MGNRDYSVSLFLKFINRPTGGSPFMNTEMVVLFVLKIVIPPRLECLGKGWNSGAGFFVDKIMR
ncbi:MAG: hypothetical protein Q7J34_09695 [Bacteroidales bacterium]|jgi:hypothetical protein|nr:hypothetical protein [Bacteroidales bacterium]